MPRTCSRSGKSGLEDVTKVATSITSAACLLDAEGLKEQRPNRDARLPAGVFRQRQMAAIKIRHRKAVRRRLCRIAGPNPKNGLQRRFKRRSSRSIEHSTFTQASAAVLRRRGQPLVVGNCGLFSLSSLALFTTRGMRAITWRLRRCQFDRTFVRTEQQCCDHQVNEKRPHIGRVGITPANEPTASLVLDSPCGNGDPQVPSPAS